MPLETLGGAANAAFRRTISKIDREPDSRTSTISGPLTLTGADERVWLQWRIYWLRCRIVKENSPYQTPAARAAGPRPKRHPGRGLRHAVAGGRIRLFRAEAWPPHRRRPHDGVASFRVQGRALALDRRSGACDRRFAPAEQGLARRSSQRRRGLPRPRPAPPPALSFAFPFPPDGS